MRMRFPVLEMLFLIAVVLLFLAAGMGHGADNAKPTFQITKGYFQVIAYSETDPNDITPYEPVSLLEPHERPESLGLASSWHYWIHLKLASGAKSPCTNKADQPCRLEADLIKRQADYSQVKMLGISLRFDDCPECVDSFGYAAKTTRDMDTGEYAFVFRIRHGDQTVFLYELPVTVH